MQRRNNCRFIASLALLLPTAALAASVAAPITACKDEADSKKVFEFISKNDASGLDKFKTSKVAAGDCSSLSKGMAVTIDKKDGQYMCVRPTGGLDCFWAAAVTINENPTQPEKAQSPQPGDRGRGGRQPQL
ncbi:hypothetical protein RZS28_18210 [Methylocapsa polymorpha]|uniref:Uncharacterized protein n=1 Tax=Methylocapsa polymorpha TaxID=3080828 RepID=A0ABZ0HSC7_9HYPH|nr:hypothetical protein RZS28_18210 [Methylocapsa sp. RX1]